MTDNDRHTASAEPQIGYKSPPTEKRFKKGRSGNPQGRPKESRNLSTVLSEVLNQPVTFKQIGKSKQLTKGDRRAADAVINLIGKIERLVDPPEAERKNVGVMLVPGTASSIEEWQKNIAETNKRQEAKHQKERDEAAVLEEKERGLRIRMVQYKDKPEAAEAAAQLAELTNSKQYLHNFYVRRNLDLKPEELETAVNATKKEPVAKLPWDPDEYVRMPFSQRAEYARTHVEKAELEAQ